MSQSIILSVDNCMIVPILPDCHFNLSPHSMRHLVSLRSVVTILVNTISTILLPNSTPTGFNFELFLSDSVVESRQFVSVLTTSRLFVRINLIFFLFETGTESSRN